MTRVLLTSYGVSSKVSVGLELMLITNNALISFVPPGKISHEGSEKGVVIFFPGRSRSSSTSQGWWWRKGSYNGHIMPVMDSPNDPHPDIVGELKNQAWKLPIEAQSRAQFCNSPTDHPEAVPCTASPQTEETGMGGENAR